MFIGIYSNIPEPQSARLGDARNSMKKRFGWAADSSMISLHVLD